MNDGYNASPGAVNAGKRIETLVNIETERDELRAVYKWGPMHGADGQLRYHLGPVDQFAELVDEAEQGEESPLYAGYLSIHTLYYLTEQQISKLLGPAGKFPLGRGRKLVAVVHRHKQNVHMTEDGERVHAGDTSMFGGEIRYEHDGISIKQTNVETGESYRHRSIDWLWTSETKVWRDPASNWAFSWDLQKFTEDTWIVKFAAVTADRDEGMRNRVVANMREGMTALRARRMVYDKENQREAVAIVQPPIQVRTGVVATQQGVVTIAYPGLEEQLKITSVPMFQYLRNEVSGKPRDDKQLQNLYAVARRHLKGQSKFPGSLEFDVHVGTLSDHVIGAFLADVSQENKMLSCVAVAASDLRMQRSLTKTAHRAHAPGVSGLVSGVARVAVVASEVLGSKNRYAALAGKLDA
jgi:hypothetical protein